MSEPSFVGRRLQDRYRVEATIGSGRMADVYRAHDTVLDRAVAIKVLTGGDAPTRARFVEEARAMAVLNHQNITAIYDFGEYEGMSYIVMEYVDGESLAEKLGNKPNFSQLQNIFLQVLAALDLAHRRNIVHRDLKPANVLAGDNGIVKVADFGLSRRISDLTVSGRPGEVVGTIGYLSPEVFLGKPSDGRSDLYSLGIMMYEAFAGRLPFRNDSGDIVAVIYAHVHEIPIAPHVLNPAISDRLERLILKLIGKDAERRFADAAAVIAELSAIPISPGVHAPAAAVKAAPEARASIDPEIRSVVDQMISPQRSAKAALGKIMTAMLATKRRDYEQAVKLYDEALIELRELNRDGEYIRGALNMGECAARWLRTAVSPIDEKLQQAALAHLETAKNVSRSRGYTEELHAAQRLLGEIESQVRPA